MTLPPTIVWLRNDLRLADNAALCAAVDRGGPVVPVFVWSPEEEGDWAPGAASRWWLHHSLAALAGALRACGNALTLRSGDTATTLESLAREVGADAVYWHRSYEPHAAARDLRVQRSLRAGGLATRSFEGALLFSPDAVRSGRGKHYRVFTPFWRACERAGGPEEPLPIPSTLRGVASPPRSLALGTLGLEPKMDWKTGLAAAWTPGLVGARAALRSFAAGPLADYAENRDRPDLDGVSRLSPHLHFGELSPRDVWHEIEAAVAAGPPGREPSADAWLRQLGWREFSAHLLLHEPATVTKPLRREFEHFPWRTDAEELRAWQQGRTGYPLVDAGMRQLWETGWMHNRVRMVVASFLVKHLLLPWHEGARWFWDTLVDADLANNTMGWQWTAGSGADAAPYFRIFNPILQGKRFDPEGAYVRQFCPELARLPDRHVHAPWTAPAEVLAGAGVVLDETWPRPLVDHAFARDRALASYEFVKSYTG